jgi:hypothetical protein
MNSLPALLRREQYDQTLCLAVARDPDRDEVGRALLVAGRTGVAEHDLAAILAVSGRYLHRFAAPDGMIFDC